MDTITLKPAKDKSLVRRHPWIYANAIARIDGSTWSIATDAIPALQMGAMTMTFLRPNAVPVDGLRVGQRVRLVFFRNADGAFEIASIAALPAGGTP